MPNMYADPMSILQLLVGSGVKSPGAGQVGASGTQDASGLPGAQTPDMAKADQSLAYSWMKPQQLQGNAYYTPVNALRDALGGFFGRQMLDKVNKETQGQLDEATKAKGGVMYPEEDNAQRNSATAKDTTRFGDAASGNQGVQNPTTPAGKSARSGAASVRNNNSGAQYPGPIATKFGSTGYQSLEGGKHKIATFSDPVQGAAAQFGLLASPGYVGKDLTSVIKKWSGGNNWQEYVKHVVSQTGLHPNTPITAEFLQSPKGKQLVQSMAYHEAGGEYPLNDQQWQQAQSIAFGGGQQAGQTAQTGQPAMLGGPNTQAKGNMLNMPPQQVGQMVSQAGQSADAGGMGDNMSPVPGSPRAPSALPRTPVPGSHNFQSGAIPGVNQSVPGLNVPGIENEGLQPPEGIETGSVTPETGTEGAIPPEEAQQTEPGVNAPTQPAGPDAQKTAQSGGLNYPASPSAMITKQQYERMERSQWISEETKKEVRDMIRQQGQVIKIPVDGGDVYHNPRTGKQTYVPQPKWGTTVVDGMNVPTMHIKPKQDGQWETKLMLPGGGESGLTDVGKSSEGGGQSDSGKTADAGQAAGGNKPSGGMNLGPLSQLKAFSRTEKAKDTLSHDLATNLGAERKTYINEGKDADDLRSTLQKMRELENSPASKDITTGSLAPLWNEFKKNYNAWLPEWANTKKGPISISDFYQAMATVAGAKLGRSTDPNMSVKQFEAMVAATPGLGQTPAARKAMLAALMHDLELKSELGKIAREEGNDQKSYQEKVTAKRKEFEKKPVIPPLLLTNLKTQDRKKVERAKWLNKGENPDDLVGVGEYFFEHDGTLRHRDE